MKTLQKAALVKRNQLAHTSTERTILQNINCPFLVHLIYAFQTTDKLYMVLDYMAGGELFFWLKKDKYVMCIVYEPQSDFPVIGQLRPFVGNWASGSFPSLALASTRRKSRSPWMPCTAPTSYTET